MSRGSNRQSPSSRRLRNQALTGTGSMDLPRSAAVGRMRRPELPERKRRPRWPGPARSPSDETCLATWMDEGVPLDRRWHRFAPIPMHRAAASALRFGIYSAPAELLSVTKVHVGRHQNDLHQQEDDYAEFEPMAA